MSEVAFLNFFTLNIPDDVLPKWTLSSVILAGPIAESTVDPRMPTLQTPRPFQSNIIVTMEQVDRRETPESYVQRQIDELRRAGVSRREAAPPQTITLSGGLEGYLTEQVITGVEGEHVHQMQLVTIKNGSAHTLIASQLDGDPFERMRDQFCDILLSFQ